MIEAVFRKKIAATSAYSENIKIERKRILFLFCLSSVSPSVKHLVIMWLETAFFSENEIKEAALKPPTQTFIICTAS